MSTSRSSISIDRIPPERAVLGVERSALGRRWVNRVEPDDPLIAALVAASGAGDQVARVLAGRGITPETVKDTLEPTLRALMPDPYSLIDCERVAQRLAQAVETGETIALFGDYDVDGATSTALAGRYLRAVGLSPLIHIPDRLLEGYGPNSPAIEDLRRQGASLLVTLDCGSSSFEPFARAKELGMDVLVIDHHQIGDAHPATDGLVNPNRGDDRSDLGYMAAVGVTFMVLVALNRLLRERGRQDLPDLMALLDLVALGTVADVVPLVGLNRAFVVRGLSSARQRRNEGFAALCDVSRLTAPPEPYHLGFMLGPRINAGGRIGNAALGTQLLMTDDMAEARAIAEKLDQLNGERQEIERLALEEAEALAMRQAETGAPVLIVMGEDWHPGVLGIIASRLKDRYDRPVFALAPTLEGLLTGSGRSIAGVDLGRAVRRLVDEGILIKGGGHAMAAGLTLETGRLPDLRRAFEDALSGTVDTAISGLTLRLDGVVTAGGISAQAVTALERAGPYGAGFAEPVFALPLHRVLDVAIVGKGGHVRATLSDGAGGKIKAIAFRAAESRLGTALMAAREGGHRHVAGTLSLDYWGGTPKPQLRIIDVAEPERR